MDLRSIPAEVHAFESHPSHFCFESWLSAKNHYFILIKEKLPDLSDYKPTMM